MYIGSSYLFYALLHYLLSVLLLALTKTYQSVPVIDTCHTLVNLAIGNNSALAKLFAETCAWQHF